MSASWKKLDPRREELPRGLDRLEAGLAVSQLWMLGAISEGPRVSIVGTRTPDCWGIVTARTLASEAARRGWTVVSGGALGIDTAAHQGALSQKGETVVVSAAGAGSIYPARNERLFAKIVSSGGAIVTETSPDTPLAGYRFLQRNRIIAALADVVLVVQARSRSGALSTARWASKLGVDVLAVPGSPLNPLHAGPNRLVAAGRARMLEHVGMIFGGRDPGWGQQELAVQPGGQKGIVFGLLGSEPMGVDVMAREASMASADVQTTLLELEVEGLAARCRDGSWIVVPRYGFTASPRNKPMDMKRK